MTIHVGQQNVSPMTQRYGVCSILQHGWPIHLVPHSHPHSVLENMPLLSYCSLNLLSIAKPKYPKGQEAFLRDSRTCCADDRHGDLVSLVFNHHCLNPLLLTHSFIFAKSLVTGTAHLFPRVVVRKTSVQSTGSGLLEKKFFVL